MWEAIRYHDFCAGHRVYGHENKCAHLHGHNYRVTFYCCGDIDNVGRVIDFSVMKSTLCEYLEQEWDHRMLLWDKDPLFEHLEKLDDKVLAVPFNPTAENMAEYLVKEVGPLVLKGTGVRLAKVKVEETRKCSATYVA